MRTNSRSYLCPPAPARGGRHAVHASVETVLSQFALDQLSAAEQLTGQSLLVAMWRKKDENAAAEPEPAPEPQQSQEKENV